MPRSVTPKKGKRTPTPTKKRATRGTPVSVAAIEKNLDDLDFDLRLETPGGRIEGRRSSFYERSKEVVEYASVQTSKHIGFVLLVFLVCSTILTPFLYGVPKIVKVPVNQGQSDCPCNASKVEFFDSEILRLKSDLATAVLVSEEETKKAEEIVVLQYEAIHAVESSIAKLAMKHEEVLLATNEGDGGRESSEENASVGNVFNTIRDDMNKLKSQVQSLSDTHLMIQQFNSHAENLIARSREIEVLIQAQNDSLIATEMLAVAECKCDEQAALPPQECATIEEGADFVNLNMARQIIADEVGRECKKKIEEVQEIYDLKMRNLGDECSEQCVKASAAAGVEEEIKSYDQRTNYASRRAGAHVLHDFTSATWKPAGVPDLASRTVSMIKNQEGLWDKTMRHLVGKKITEAIDFTALESTLRNVAETVGVTKKPQVGAPEDAISADMSLGSCWPMADGTGHITIKLARPVLLTALSIEHIPQHEAVDIRSAPKDFSLFAVTDPAQPDSEGSLLVDGFYSIEAGTPSLQLFEIQSSVMVEFIRLDILSNHGHPDFACLYRIRIHGS